MKGMISGIKRMEIHDGDGLRTTVFFKGCPLRCIWCHNPESLSFACEVAFFKEKCISCGTCGGVRGCDEAELCPTNALITYGREYELSELLSVILRDAPFFENGGGGVTLSGGECLAQPEFAIALARELHERNISVYIDTCGHVRRDILEKIIPYTDKFLYDVKAFSDDVHVKCTGVGNRLILDNLRFLSEVGCKIEIRYPLIMGYNDGECEKIAEFLKSLRGIEKVKVLKYHSLAASRYEALGMVNTLPDTVTLAQDVQWATDIFRGFGIYAVNGTESD